MKKLKILLAQKEREIEDLKILMSLLNNCKNKVEEKEGYFLHISDLEEVMVEFFSPKIF